MSASNAPPPGSGPAISQNRNGRHDGQYHNHHHHHHTPPAPSAGQQLTHRDTESWIEVSSHPSSSSVSSIGDEIVTAGLNVRNDIATRRRRLHPRYYTHLTSPPNSPPHRRAQLPQSQSQPRQPLPPRSNTAPPAPAPAAGGSSSQEEYDESDSEEDRVLTSSSENISSPAPLPKVLDSQAIEAVSSEEDEDDCDDDDDDHATALGRRPSEPFRPQPNAFSHPPSHLTHRSSTSAIPPHHPRPSFSQRAQTRTDRAAGNFMSPADNDAALRASLTTLLSVAAAARGRAKDGVKDLSESAAVASSSQPVELRFIPESELLAPSSANQTAQQGQRQAGAPSSASRNASGEKAKRSSTPTGSNRSPRATKKKKTSATTDDTLISPALMPWVVGAGVVVLVSVVGFGAGYVIGREVGRQENLASLTAGNASTMSEGANCGREVLRNSGGLKRQGLRWGAAVGKSVTV